MYRTRCAAAGCALLVALSACSPPISGSDLAQRVRTSHPKWQSYQEDVKAQIGAGPVAEWTGEPIKATQDTSTFTLTFRLLGPWSLREAAMPVLIRDPLGHVHQNSAATRQNDLIMYEFKLEPAGSASPLPWIEVKFPNGGKRIVLDEKGRWNSA